MASATNPDDYVLIQVVGVFTIDDGTSPFWYISGGISTYSTSFLIDYDTCQEILFQDFETIYLSGTQWRYAIDYTSLEISDLDTLVPTLQQHETEYNRMTGFTGYRVPMLETLVDYNQRCSGAQDDLVGHSCTDSYDAVHVYFHGLTDHCQK